MTSINISGSLYLLLVLVVTAVLNNYTMERAVLYTMILCVIFLSLSAAKGKEAWGHAIDEISDTGAASDAEIYCIISSHGFEQLDILDSPSTIDFIVAGIKDTSTCSCNCVKN